MLNGLEHDLNFFTRKRINLFLHLMSVQHLSGMSLIMCQVRTAVSRWLCKDRDKICCRDRYASGSTLKQSVNERRNYRPGRKNYQSAKQNQPHDNWKKPEFFPLFHKRPHIHQELTHNASYINLPPGKRKPRWVPLTTAMAVTDNLRNAAAKYHKSFSLQGSLTRDLWAKEAEAAPERWGSQCW
jgi:hypothetical protein